MNAYCRLPGWPTVVEPLLEQYLQRLGVTSAATRAYWIETVDAGLTARNAAGTPQELAEDALEILHQRIAERLASSGVIDPHQDTSGPDRLFTVLLSEPQAALLNALFDTQDADIDPLLRERLRAELTAQAPRPVPAAAPLAMPEQSIALRSLNPLRRPGGKPA